MNVAADLDLAAQQFRGLCFEDGPVIVPIDEERRRKKGTEHKDQSCRQRE